MKYKIKEIPKKEILTAFLNDSLETTYQKIKNHHIRHLPVLDNENKLIGLISEKDLLRASQITNSNNLEFDNKKTVSDYMSSPVITINENAELTDVIKKMLDHQISSVLITDNDSVIGIITSNDLLHILNKLLKPQKVVGFPEIWNLIYRKPIGEIAFRLAELGL